MKQINLPFAVSLTTIFFVFGLAGGYFISPTYEQSMYTKEKMDFGPVDRYVDLRYLDQMTSHHKAAMLLANQIVEQTHRKEIKNLALSISSEEPKLINQLYLWKKEWYKDLSKAKDPEVVQLGDYDENLDLRFLNALIAHHEDGIKMTQEIRTKSTRNEVLDNANEVEIFLNDGIAMLTQWREEWYGIK